MYKEEGKTSDWPNILEENMFWPHFITSLKSIPSERKEYTRDVYAWGQEVRMYPPARVQLWTTIHRHKRISVWLGLWAPGERKQSVWSEVAAERIKSAFSGEDWKGPRAVGGAEGGRGQLVGWTSQEAEAPCPGEWAGGPGYPPTPTSTPHPPRSKHLNYIKGAGSGGQRRQPQGRCGEQVNPTAAFERM